MKNRIEWKQSVLSHLRESFDNKIYLLGILILTVAAYGFTFSHFSMGIDDFGSRYYLDFSQDSYANMIQQGRLLHVALYYICGLVDVVPFLNNFISALLMASSAVVLIALFEVSVGKKFNVCQKLIFFGLYISYPILAFKFIYDIDVVVTSLSYLCAPLGLVFGLSFIETKKVQDVVLAGAFLFVAIGSYETFNAVYICLVLMLFIFLCCFKDYKTNEVFAHGMILAAILGVAFALYYALVKLVQVLTHNPAYPRYNIFTSDASKLNAIKNILKKLFNPNLLFTVEFAVCVLIFIALVLWFIIRKKRPIVLLLGIGFGAFLIVTNIIQGNLHYRACQPFNLFISGTALLLFLAIGDKAFIKGVVSVALSLLVLLQLKDINLWFYKDYANYQKNVYAIHNIATELYSEYSVNEKPVCFVNRNYDSFLMSWDAEVMQVEIGESPIVSSVRFLGDKTSDATFQLFEFQEYDKLIHPNEEEATRAVEHSKNMPTYPEKGYIEELDDIIVVNLGVTD